MMRLVFVFLWNLCLIVNNGCQALSFYSSGGPINEYSKEQDFLKVTTKRVVEFYSPTCPACQAFKSEYIDLANRAKAKFDDVDFFAVNCDEYFNFCKSFHVTSFPTLKVFQEGKKDRIGIEIPSSSHRPLLELITKELQLTTPRKTGGLKPEVQRITRDSQLDRFQEQMKVKKQSYKRKNLKVKQSPLEGPNSMTKIMKVNDPGTMEYKERQKALLERLKKIKESRKFSDAKPPPLPTRPTETNDKNKMELLPYQKDVRNSRPMILNAAPWLVRKQSVEERLLLDVTNSLYMSLKNGLFLKSDKLSPRGLIAFRDFLDLLIVSLPLEWRLQKLIGELRRNFVKIGSSRESLLKVLDKHSIKKGWSSDCLATGFTCGFWKMLHTVSVGVAEQRGGLALLEADMVKGNTRTFSPIEAADTIRNYISHFFTCEPCRVHFLEIYDTYDTDRREDLLIDEKESASIADWKQLGLWLWKFHNDLSVQILHDKEKKAKAVAKLRVDKKKAAISSLEVQVLWPTMDECFLCFKDDGSWNEAEVFAYLEKAYWPGSEVDPRTDKLLKFEGEDYSSPSRTNTFALFCISVFMYLFYQVISRNSSRIQRSLLQAKLMVNLKVEKNRKV